MHTDFFAWLDQHQGRQYDLHAEHINPSFVKMLRTIGFDKGYVRGEGCYLWDADGNKYLDLLTGWGVFALGRNHPKVKAILQQLHGPRPAQPGPHGLQPAQRPGRREADQHTPRGDFSRVFFCNSGTETVEGAIKFARCSTGRQDIVYCDHAFHGLTTGSLALNGADFFRERFGDLMPGTQQGSVQ